MFIKYKIERRKDEKKERKGRREGGGRAGMKEVLRKLMIRNILMSPYMNCKRIIPKFKIVLKSRQSQFHKQK